IIKRPVHNSLARWRRGITAAALAAAAGSAGGSAARGGRRARLRRGSRLFSFFVHYLFRLRPQPCCPSGRPGAAPLAGQRGRRGELGHPRAPGSRAAPPGRAGTRGGSRRRLRAARRRLSPPPGPPPARPPPRPGPGRGREPPRAAAPCAPRPAPRAGAQLPAPAGQPARPQPRANFCSGARRSSRRSSRRVKPPGARAAARVRTEAPPRGRGTGEAAGFKWGPSGGSGAVRRGGSVDLPSPRRGAAGPPPGKFAPGALVPRAEMLLRDLVLRRGCCWPSLLLHCALHPLWGFVQVTHGEPQKSCSKVADSCPHICQCRPPPLLPPPPPPPPPPRLLSAPGKERLSRLWGLLCRGVLFVFSGPGKDPGAEQRTASLPLYFSTGRAGGKPRPNFPCRLQNAFPTECSCEMEEDVSPSVNQIKVNLHLMSDSAWMVLKARAWKGRGSSQRTGLKDPTRAHAFTSLF
uniref:Uncharacterized protein n=2 Tax=Canis lupus TaxID=9612 RepID=A0A8C0PY20_CANLF